MAKLNQIIAIEKGTKSRVYSELTELNKAIQKPELFNGFTKTYQKKEDEGEELPPEKKRVIFTSSEVLSKTQDIMTELMDLTARKDWSNCKATANVKVNGDEVLIKDAPVSFLLFLEKQLTDLRTLVNNIPVLDEADRWDKDLNSGYFRSEAIQTHRTRKVQKPIVLYDATKEHPAQTQIITEDIIAGFWNQVKMSGAMPKPDKQTLSNRVEHLLNAVKEAREAANSTDEAAAPEVGEKIFSYLLQDVA